jgi:hypothetical protein
MEKGCANEPICTLYPVPACAHNVERIILCCLCTPLSPLNGLVHEQTPPMVGKDIFTGDVHFQCVTGGKKLACPPTPPWLVVIFLLIMMLYGPRPWSVAIFYQSVGYWGGGGILPRKKMGNFLSKISGHYFLLASGQNFLFFFFFGKFYLIF